MAKFLDLEGLQSYDTKIKTYVNTGLGGKANTSHGHANYSLSTHTHNDYIKQIKIHGPSGDGSDYLSAVEIPATEQTILIKGGNNVYLDTEQQGGSSGPTSLRINAIVPTYSAATGSNAGLMSAQDKNNLTTLVGLLGSDSGDSDTVVNTIREVLAIFANYGESTTVVNALAGKADNGHTHNSATLSVDGFMASSDKTKLNGIEAGAQVNVKPSWTAASGHPTEILNKPVALKNPYSLTINGTVYDGSAAKTVTIDKTALGLGNVTNVNTANASNISSGTLPDARLSSAVATAAITTAEIDALFV